MLLKVVICVFEDIWSISIGRSSSGTYATSRVVCAVSVFEGFPGKTE